MRVEETATNTKVGAARGDEYLLSCYEGEIGRLEIGVQTPPGTPKPLFLTSWGPMGPQEGSPQYVDIFSQCTDPRFLKTLDPTPIKPKFLQFLNISGARRRRRPPWISQPPIPSHPRKKTRRESQDPHLDLSLIFLNVLKSFTPCNELSIQCDCNELAHS